MVGTIDKLLLVYGADFKASENIVLKHPKVGDIVNIGEKRYFDVVSLLTAIPSDMKSLLFDAGIDYMEMPDFDLFMMLVQSLDQEASELFFYDINLSEMVPCQREDGERLLVLPNSNCIIDKLVYGRIVEFLASVFHIEKNVERAGNEFTKRVLIDEDREKRANANKKEFRSSLLPLISSMVNSKGFKYGYVEVLAMPFSQFMDAVARVQTITSVDQMAFGYYSGSFDPKKFDIKKLDWMRDLNK